MNKYRTHNCAELTEKNTGDIVSLSGWLHRKRDHGNLLFIDLRDSFGLTQCVIENKNKLFPILEKIKQESVLTISGKVIERSKETQNLELATGKIEIEIQIKLSLRRDFRPSPLPGVCPEQKCLKDPHYFALDKRLGSKSALKIRIILLWTNAWRAKVP